MLQATLKTDITTIIPQTKGSPTFSTFGFARHKDQRFAKPKELTFQTAQNLSTTV
jgi:hypothetical protein